ncbi:MAG: tRNA glutamyl-Q(34) synthetase GluQRS [Verrucomicrobiota bacterium]|nr:tRNA glutamyl-Q(34) synthetase GluQRS [Verrucomicrobiota bacterium]
MVITRFAPSPTGRLHMGHAYSALFAESLAANEGGEFLLRIEDIDANRCRKEYTEGIYEDLQWLGICWQSDVLIQSTRFDAYKNSLNILREMGVLYPCFCSRKKIEAEQSNAGLAPHGSGSPKYLGHCRKIDSKNRRDRIAQGEPHSWRLDCSEAFSITGDLRWVDRLAGTITVDPSILGDVIISRKDIATSYHLAVTLDDAEQGITLISRGEDLMESTHVHRLLQCLLDLPVPQWCHHKLIKNPEGKRFSKREGGLTLKQIRDSGIRAEDLRNELGF